MRTLLCELCNNRLGTRVEVELLDWRDWAMRNPRASAAVVQGNRRINRVFYRRAPDGRFVLCLADNDPSEIRTMLNSGEFTYTYSPPNENRYKLAALKHAYLAACLDRREVPATPTADVIRAELLAARDATSNRSVPVGDYAASFPVIRTYRQPHGPSIALGIFRREGLLPVYGISLAGSVLVPWPMHDFPPMI